MPHRRRPASRPPRQRGPDDGDVADACRTAHNPATTRTVCGRSDYPVFEQPDLSVRRATYNMPHATVNSGQSRSLTVRRPETGRSEPASDHDRSGDRSSKLVMRFRLSSPAPRGYA